MGSGLVIWDLDFELSACRVQAGRCLGFGLGIWDLDFELSACLCAGWPLFGLWDWDLGFGF